MKMEARTMALDKIYKRRNRYDVPDWQRDPDIWSTEKKQLLIDSILRGWKLPKLYFAMTSDAPQEYDVVDGQQRLNTIFEFLSGDLELSAASALEFGGKTYATLPDAVSDRFDDFEIEYDEITEATDEELQQFFQRLQGGMQLTAAEKLNSVTSNLTNFSRDLAKHPFFDQKVAIRNTRKAHFDIASKVAAIEVEGLNAGLRYDDLKAVFEAGKGFSFRSKVATRLKETLDYIDNVFPSRNSILRNRSTIQSFITLSARIVESGKAEGAEARLRRFFEHFGAEIARQVELGQDATDLDYLAFQRTLSANVKLGAKARHEILMRKLFLFDSTWVDVLGAESIVLVGISADVERLGAEVARLVAAKNEEYASAHGADLFKMTNKTATALAHLRQPISNFEQYSGLVGDLYFLFREGPGQRLAGRTPSSFEDINLLRTGLQHDVDHGKMKDVMAKRKKIGETFSRYAAGATSPSTLAPERFLIVQAGLLGALASDLRLLRFDHNT